MLCPIAKIAKSFPDEIAVIEKDLKFSYSELDDIISDVRFYLLNSGVNYGDRVALLGENSINYIVFLFAIWRLNAQAFPVNPGMPVEGIKHILGNTDTKFLICNRIELGRSDFENVKIIDISIKQINSKCTSKKKELVDIENPSLLIQTSGTSSEGKIVVLSFSNLYYSAIGVLDRLDLLIKDRWLLSLPLFHVGGIGVLTRCFLKGAKVVIHNRNMNLLENIVENKITHLSLVSTQLYKLIDEVKGSEKLTLGLKSVLLGGSSIPEDLIKTSLKLDIPVFTSYGSSEMGSTVSIEKQSKMGDNLYSSGKLLKYRSIKINDDNEIFLKGKTLCKGYIREKRVVLPVDKDGWFKTGDIGFLNQDNELFITGRKDNMFISGGENIQPEEIERTLHGFLGIIESKVISVKNKKFGFRPIAFLKTKDGTIPDKELLIEHLNKKLPKYKIPDAFYLWHEGDQSKYHKTNVDIKKN